MSSTIIITKTALYGLISFIGLFGLAILGLILVFFLTPARAFLLAKIKGLPLMMVINRGQRMSFRVGKETSEGVIEVKRVGTFQLTENSHITTINGVNMFMGFGEFVGTIPINYVSVINAIREAGYSLDQWSDYNQLIDNKELLKDLAEAKKLSKNEYENLRLNLLPFKTIKLHELAYMFPKNWTPGLAESRLENAMAMKVRSWASQVNIQTAIVITVIFVGIVIAAVILYKFMGPGVGSSVGGAAAVIGQNM